jgi:hypothetical protein
MLFVSALVVVVDRGHEMPLYNKEPEVEVVVAVLLLPDIC